MDKRGKSLLVVGIFLLVIGIFSSYFVIASNGNVINYENENKIATIKNSLGDTIAKAELKTPFLNYVIQGKDRKVMIFDIENFGNTYSNALANMEIINMKNSEKEIKDFHYEYAIYDDVEVLDYKEICTERNVVANETTYKIQDCKNEVIGSHFENKIINWKVLNSKDIPKGNLTIALVTDVKTGDHYDGIPTLFEMKIDKWAEWTESLNIGLKSYYTLNETSGTISADDLGLVNGTSTGTTLGATGILSKALSFDGDTDTTDINYFWNNGTDGVFSINLWVKPTTMNQAGGIIFNYGSNSGEPRLNQISVSANQYLIGAVIDNGYENIAKATTATGWVMFTLNTFTYDNKIEVYYNGTLLGNVSYTGAEPTTNIRLRMGSYLGGETIAEYSGLVDEVGIWNRSLSATEVTQLLNEGKGITYTLPPEDTTPPNVAIVSPLNINYTIHSIDFNLSVIDDSAIDSCWYNLNDGTNVTMNDGVPDFYHINSSIKKGTYTTKFYCKDIYDNLNDTEQVSFTILNAHPTQNTPSLKTSTGKNLSSEDLICYNQSTYDADNDEVTNIYNWYKDSQPFLALNLPFEINVEDYSGNNNNGTKYGNPQFVDGKYGKALNFDGGDDYVSTSYSSDLTFRDNITIEVWFKTNNISGSSSNDNNIVHYGEYDEALLYINNGQICGEVVTDGWYNSCFSSLSTNTWYHAALTYKSSDGYFSMYLNGDMVGTKTTDSNLLRPSFLGYVYIARNGLDNHGYFNGSIDEVKIYPYVLTPEQILANFNLEYNKIVSEETAGGDNYMCQVTPNDAEADGETLNSSSLDVLWRISFNITSGEDGSQLNNFNIVCNNSWSVNGANSFEEFGFEEGNYECIFTKTLPIEYFDKTITFTADSDKIVPILMSEKAYLTIEEHTWLEAIYNCISGGDCALYNLLLEINQTTGNIWEHTKPTDGSVVTIENIINKIVDSNNNLTINYTVNIPIKTGYASGTYLPIRIGFWFLDENNITCYNQGNKPTGVEEPYCQPLIIETLGPMGGSVSFTVKLQPQLPTGNYSIKRIIDIDPNNVWINYGQDIMGTIRITEPLNSYGITLDKTGENIPNSNQQKSDSKTTSSSSSSSSKKITNVYNTYNTIEQKQETSSEEGIIRLSNSKITGAVTGSNLLSGGSFVIILSLFTGLFALIIISRTILKVKKK